MRSTIILLVLQIVVVNASGGERRAVPAAIRERVAKLPTKLTELYRAEQTDLAGSTASMTKGLVSISRGLLEDAVVLQTFATNQPPSEVRREIQRDQEAIVRSFDYERNAEGRARTITGIEASAAAPTHVENLISFYVTRIFENEQSFELQSWYTAWREAAKRDKLLR